MPKRRRSWLIVALLACTALAVYFEPTRRVRGWLWGEAFFAGRPTSHWRAVIVADLQTDPRILFGTMPPPPGSWWTRSLSSLGIKPRADTSFRLVHDTDADAVLHQLTNDDNVRVAGFAKDLLHAIRPQQPFPDDSNEAFRSWRALIDEHHPDPQNVAKHTPHE